MECLTGTSGFVENAKKRAMFTEIEKQLLMDIVLSHKGVIENKKTDAVWTNQKAAEWEKVVEEFNAMNASGLRRTSKQLKILYKNLKATARHNLAKDNVSFAQIDFNIAEFNYYF